MNVLKASRRKVFPVILAAAAVSAVHAAEIYRWTDENGVVHFSQTAPPVSTEADRVELQDTRPSDFDPEADIYGVAEQEARMQALREEREQKRQERLEHQSAVQSQAPVQQYGTERRGYPAYWSPGLPARPPLRPMPPIERPPPGPGGPIRPPRPITPKF